MDAKPYRKNLIKWFNTGKEIIRSGDGGDLQKFWFIWDKTQLLKKRLIQNKKHHRNEKLV
jgi:hypothetical protein